AAHANPAGPTMAPMRASEFMPSSPTDAGTRAGDQPRNLRERLVPPMPPASWWGWAGPLLVTVFGGFLRFYPLGAPPALGFHPTYYVPDAWSILKHGGQFKHPKNRNPPLLHGHTPTLTP